MTKKVIFIADFFANQVAGGGELNNEEAIKLLEKKGYKVAKLNSRNCTADLLKNCRQYFFIIANFVELNKDCLDYLENNCRYIIYEHDHKYLKTRNPADFPDYIAPKDQIINESFYQKAVGVLCQSNFHKNIMLKNISNVNVVNLSGNLWSMDEFSLMNSLQEKQKEDSCAIMDTQNWHKNTAGAVKYCISKNYKYNLIGQMKYEEFLRELSNNNKLVFFPQTPETLSRIVVECRMMGMSVTTNDKVGATQEPWFSLKGHDLIREMFSRRETIIDTIEGFINE